MHATKFENTCFYYNHTSMHAKEIKDPWTKFDGEQTLELEIEKFIALLSPYPFYIEGSNDQAS